MRYRFIKEWHEFKVGDRVPASVNHHWLKRHGYIAHYSFTQEAQELIAECIQELAQEAPKEAQQVEEEPQASTKPTGKGKRNA